MIINIEKFNSISDFVKTINKRPPNEIFSDCPLSSKTGSLSFTGTKYYSEAEELLQYGWDKYLDQIKKGMGESKVTSYRSSRKVETNVVGFTPCVPRAIQGLPDSMYNTRNYQKKVATICLVYDIRVACNIDTEDIIKAGIKLLTMVNALEAKGIKVQLDISAGFYKDGGGFSEMLAPRICMKRYKDNLDLKKLTFPLIHPSMFRRICFKYLETYPKLKNEGFKWGYGSGVKQSSEKDFEEYKKALLGKNEYWFDYYSIEGKDPEQILKENGIIK